MPLHILLYDEVLLYCILRVSMIQNLNLIGIRTSFPLIKRFQKNGKAVPYFPSSRDENPPYP
jgi:hypothetical protein